jgi:chromosome segregation ATPase
MSDTNNVARNLRERFSGTTEERLGRALSDLLENPLLTGALGRAFDAREKAVQAQEVAMGALNLPSAADIERLTRRLRSVSHRLEGIEDGVDRLDRALAPSSGDPSEIGQRLSAVEEELKRLSERIDQSARPASAAKAKSRGAKAARRGAKTATRGAHPATRARKPATARARPEQA